MSAWRPLADSGTDPAIAGPIDERRYAAHHRIRTYCSHAEGRPSTTVIDHLSTRESASRAAKHRRDDLPGECDIQNLVAVYHLHERKLTDVFTLDLSRFCYSFL
jgi:hypothetical protein